MLLLAEPQPEEEEFDEEATISYYYRCGFEYKEIITFLSKRHNYEISVRTLFRKLKSFGLSRRDQMLHVDPQQLRRRLEQIIQGPGSCGGYRTVWHTLRKEGFQAPRNVIANLLKELDPEGTDFRKARKLKRRQYRNPGPNFAWHIDGYDKIKPYGFSIHGAIDGFSRKLIWLHVCRSNKSPDKIAKMYIDAVINFEGCPVELITDLGTENAIVAAIQAYFRDDPDAHRYVPSTRNQRIEAWWSILSKTRFLWWRHFFSNLESNGSLNLCDELEKECIWYTFSRLIQQELDELMEHWNTHRIRKSRHNTVSGRPDAIFFNPDSYGGNDMKVQVEMEEITQAIENINEPNEENDYTEYFNYVMRELSFDLPTSWEVALELYEQLLSKARDE